MHLENSSKPAKTTPSHWSLQEPSASHRATDSLLESPGPVARPDTQLDGTSLKGILGDLKVLAPIVTRLASNSYDCPHKHSTSWRWPIRTLASLGLTDIRHQGRCPGEDAHHGHHRTEQAPCPSVVHAGVQRPRSVEVCLQGDRTVAQVAWDFELTETAVRAWVRQAETDAGERPGADQRRACRVDPAASGEPPPAAGCGHFEAGNGLLREGDPVKLLALHRGGEVLWPQRQPRMRAVRRLPCRLLPTS